MVTTEEPGKPRRGGRSRRLTEQMAATIKKRLSEGVLQHRIAAEFDVNQGRISEINTGKEFAHVAPAI